MDTRKFKQEVYMVIKHAQDCPNNDLKALADVCQLSINELMLRFDYIDDEQLLRGLQFSRGGQHSAPLMVFFDNARITARGIDYIEQYEKTSMPVLQEVEKPTVFVSYKWREGDAFADSLEKKLSPCAIVKRDKNDVKPWGSIREFMSTIRDQDFIVALIGEEYIKSIPCMFEMTELMKERDWRRRVMFVVPDESLYGNEMKTGIIEYWQDKYSSLNNEANRLTPETMGLHTDIMRKVSAIIHDITVFLDAISDSRNPKLWDAFDCIIDRIRQHQVALVHESTPEEALAVKAKRDKDIEDLLN